MKPTPTPFWKQPRGMVVLGLGGALVLATVWLGVTRLGGTSAVSAEAVPTRNRMDENALIAANAERPDAAVVTPESANVIEASADAKPDEETGNGENAEPGESRFNPSEIQREADALIEDAEAQADKLEAQADALLEEEDGK